MSQIFNGMTVTQLHDTLKVGQWLQLARHEPVPVCQVRQIDQPGQRVELASGAREPFWVPFWYIDSGYKQAAAPAAELLDRVCKDLGL